MAKGKGFGGFGGGMNMQAMMKQAQKMQESMLKAQEEIAQVAFNALLDYGSHIMDAAGAKVWLPRL
jgi:uncharacterized protein YutE (UPF0331/DUF86 family)